MKNTGIVRKDYFAELAGRDVFLFPYSILPPLRTIFGYRDYRHKAGQF